YSFIFSPICHLLTRDLHSFPRRRSSDPGHAIRALSKGEIWANARVLADFVRELLSSQTRHNLTPREAQILDLIARGRRSSRTKSDRKSTRLNSSHRTISYAVFCLKKKKK